ncbi:MAG: hypothetical protein IT292_09165 [Deltaproteobacteria bacterium]|nr:hypothetical protein [Deltaproteobacteria bacterium]
MATGKPLLRLVQEKEPKDEGYRTISAEFWTAQQRAMHSLHYAISYRGAFRPELPDYCIRKYSEKGAVVCDPFCGRGTTAVQANLLGRVAWISDINPLAARLSKAKLEPCGLDEIVLRLTQTDFNRPIDLRGYQENFAPFYHPDTYRELVNLKASIRSNFDRIGAFIELLAMSRLHGHTSAFFSAYTFPQLALPPEKQILMNKKRRSVPDYMAVSPRIIKRSAQVLRDGVTRDFLSMAAANRVQMSDARNLSWAETSSVDLILTAPPQFEGDAYLYDHWLECWFSDLNPRSYAPQLANFSELSEWRHFMAASLQEMCRILKPNRFAVINVGSVESVTGEVVNLSHVLIEEAKNVRFDGKRLAVEQVLINEQGLNKISDSLNDVTQKDLSENNCLVVMRCVSPQPRRRS